MITRAFAVLLGGIVAAVTSCKDDGEKTSGGDASAGTAGGTAGVGGSAGAAGTGGAAGMTGTGGSGSGGAAGRDGSSGGNGGADASPPADTARTGDGGRASPMMSFFVTSIGSGEIGGALGGLEGADTRCQMLAAGVGLGNKTWRAWLSVERGPGGIPVHAKDRIGPGPWYDSRGRLIAKNLADLLPGPNMKPRGDRMATNDLVDENGNPVTKMPVQHDILTGTKADGSVAVGLTCNDWTDGTMSFRAMLGHSDNLGPNYLSWTEAHASRGCSRQGVAAQGGNGRFYCFAPN